MNIDKILSVCDHTLLLQTATPDQIIALCNDALKYKYAHQPIVYALYIAVFINRNAIAFSGKLI